MRQLVTSAPQVLDPDRDRETWLRYWQATGREPFAHPSYGPLFTGERSRAIALVFELDKDFALLPLIIRPLPQIPGIPSKQFDAISPYGYGGPFFSGRADPERVLVALRRWASESRICSVFLRLSLEVKIDSGIHDGTVIEDRAQNVVVDLLRTNEEIWMGYEHKVRKSVKKALRGGCEVERVTNLDDPTEFMSIYNSTMTRRRADQRYVFGVDFYNQIGRELRGSFSVFNVRDEAGRMISAELVLESDQYLYSFLGGTEADAFHLAPNSLLKHEVIQYGLRTGRRGFVLGGGATADDGIFKYKQSFDRSGLSTFRTGRLIPNKSVYEELVRKRTPQLSLGDSSYFPAYRLPDDPLT